MARQETEYRATAVDLAAAHRKEGPGTSESFPFPDPTLANVRRLEVSGSAPRSLRARYWIESSFTSVASAARLFTLMRVADTLKTQSSMMMLRFTSLDALVHQLEQPTS